MSLIEVKLRPTGPWRAGDRAGNRERVDVIYHSDALYSAVTHAMRALGWLEEWLDATARAAGAPAVRFSSLFPFLGRTRLAPPPKSAWPPAHPGKLYLQGAKLVPLDVVRSGVVEESRWQVDGESECLLPMGGNAPFRVSLRAAAAVDRLTGAAEPHRTACVEFAPNAGWWGVFEVTEPVWEPRVKSAFRLLADSGFGGERSRGWGRAGEPQFSEAAHLFRADSSVSPRQEGLLWLLSLYSPHETDAVDWSRGDYAVTVRGGWTESVAGAAVKKQARMIEEGSVLAAATLRGQAVNVSPEGFAHPVYRAGFALAMPVPAEIVVRTADVVRPSRSAGPVTTPPPPPSEEPPALDGAETPESAFESELPELPENAATGEPEAPFALQPAEAEIAPEQPLASPEAAAVAARTEAPGNNSAAADVAATEFAPEEPLVTPGDDALSSAAPVAAAGSAAPDPFVVTDPEPGPAPDPFGEAEPEMPGNVSFPPVAPAEASLVAETAEPGSSSDPDFPPEEPLVTPGDDAVSGEQQTAPVRKPDEAAE